MTAPHDDAAGLAGVLDPASATPLRSADASGVHAVLGRVDGARVVAYTADAARLGGAGCENVLHALDVALERGVPLVGLWSTSGARPPRGVDALDALGRLCAATARAWHAVPQVSVVFGTGAGGAAHCAVLADLVVLAPARGEAPPVGGRFDMVDVLARDGSEACARARALVALLAKPGAVDPARVGPGDPVPPGADVPALLRGLVDDGRFEEIRPGHAPNMVVGLARLAGATVGLVANNRGPLDAAAADKAAGFVRLCDAFGVPLVVIADVPADVPAHQLGAEPRWGEEVRTPANLVRAFAEATVPSVTLVTGRALGEPYIAMNARSLGATAVYAWPDARIAHGAAGARAFDIGAVDEVIDPADTRRKLAGVLALAPPRRAAHGEIPI
ncbi:carboxyl transferase domain-containing protein [Actinokineospora sp. G85]|uniref:carboxyl transferase domain-containing protein n=1 Tax=Actinokineospora sp. G85 TaxID=3406626 RepID=UPI003C76B504